MKDEAEVLSRLRRSFAAVAPDDTGGPDCPPAERIWEGAAGELGPEGLRELLAHIAVCAPCTEAWRLADRLEEGTLPAEGETHRRRSSQRRWWPLGVAAAIAAVVLVPLTLDLSEPAPAVRAAAGEEIILLSDAPLPRDRALLRWQPVEAASHYNLRVAAEADPMEPLVVARELEEAEYMIPSAALSGVASGGGLVVHLEAVHPLAGRLAAGTFTLPLQ